MHSRPTIETNGEKRLTLLMKTEDHASALIKLHPQSSLQASRHSEYEDRVIRFLQVLVGQTELGGSDRRLGRGGVVCGIIKYCFCGGFFSCSYIFEFFALFYLEIRSTKFQTIMTVNFLAFHAFGEFFKNLMEL